MPATLAHLDAFGVADAIRAEAITIRKMGMFRDQKPLMSG
jgi:hypothetical protein